MKLGDLTKKLYQKGNKVDQREMADDSYDVANKDQPQDRFEKIEEDIITEQGVVESSKAEKFIFKGKMTLFAGIIAGILVSIVLLVFGYYRFIGSAFLEEKVTVEIEGPEEVQSADDATYKIKISNGNRVDLNNCKVKLGYPNEMVLDKKDFLQVQGFNSAKVDVGQVKAKSNKEFSVSFKPFGPRDRQVYLNASLTYQPSNFSSDFDKGVQKSVLIKSSPISITIVPMQQAASGEIAEVQIIVKNENSKQYGNLELRVDYPEGFTFTQSDVLPSKDNRVWNIGSLAAKEQKKFSIKGVIEGTPESLKKFTAVVGESRDDDKFLAFTQIDGSVKIVPSRVEIIQEISNQNKVYAGTQVEYKIYFKNTSEVALRDLVLTAHIASEVLDKRKIEARGGYYDDEKQAFIWRAAQIPKLKLLEPQEKGEVSFFVKVLENFPMKNENDKNFTIKSFVELESLDVDSPLWQNKKILSPERIVKINSKTILIPKIFFNDGELANTGPIPPKARQETTFTVRWGLMNTSNDLKNVVIKTSLPPGVKWKNSYLPMDPGIEFNERTNEFIWRVGTMEAGMGFISPIKNIAFQIGVIPAESQIGDSVTVLDKVRIEALDSFTGNDVEYEFRNMSLFDIEDAKGVVQPAD